MFFDNNGNPLAGGKLYSYLAGTSTPSVTYIDAAGTPNANPVILDSAGRAAVYLGARAYKFELRTSADVLVWTQDNISDSGALLKAALAAPTGATLIGYQASVGGAPATTVAAMLDRLLDIRSFGATCDNVTNDSAAIQAAVNYVVSLGGGKVSWPAGCIAFTGSTTILIPNTNNGVTLESPGFGTSGIRYTGTGAALQFGVYAADTYTYRAIVRGLRVDITGAGTNAIGIQTWDALFWDAENVFIVAGGSAGNKTGIQMNGGNATDHTFGAHCYWRNTQINSQVKYGVHLKGTIGWGVNACVFSGGAIQGPGPSGSNIGFWIEQGNQNVITMVDVENFTTGIKIDAFDNAIIGGRGEGNTTDVNLTAADGTHTGGTFTRVFSSFFNSITDNSGGSSMIWGSSRAGSIENHITNSAFIDVNVSIPGNTGLTWANSGGSSGLFWLNGAGALKAAFYNPGNPTLLCGTPTISSSCNLDTYGSSINLKYQGDTRFMVDSGANTSSQNIVVTGNHALSFNNAGGGGSTGLSFNTGAALANAGFIIDNGAFHYWQVGSAASNRNFLVDAKGTSIDLQINAASKLKIDSGIHFTLPLDITGNSGLSFNQSGGGGSTGLIWNTGPGVTLSGTFVDNGVNLEMQAGYAAVARNIRLNANNAASSVLLAAGGVTGIDVNSTRTLIGNLLYPQAIAFASLGTPGVGALVFCSNCTSPSNPCSGAGGGALAFRQGGTWKCY